MGVGVATWERVFRASASKKPPAGQLLLDSAGNCPHETHRPHPFWMNDNPMHFSKKRPRRFKSRPGVAAPNNPTSDSADMDPNAEDSGDLNPEIVQEIAEAKMAGQDRSAGEATASPEASAAPADEASDSAPPPSPPQRQNQPPSRDPQAREQAAQQRREQDQQRREQENLRRQQEQQRRQEEQRRREEETRRRQQEQARREAEDRARLPMDDLCKKAWEVYIAEVSEEGVELFPDNDARELARRSFRLAEIFLMEELRMRRPPAREPREPRPENGNGQAQGDPAEGQSAEAPAAEAAEG